MEEVRPAWARMEEVEWPWRNRLDTPLWFWVVLGGSGCSALPLAEREVPFEPTSREGGHRPTGTGTGCVQHDAARARAQAKAQIDTFFAPTEKLVLFFAFGLP